MKFISKLFNNYKITWFFIPLILLTMVGYLLYKSKENFYNSEETKKHIIEMRQLRPDLFYSNGQT
jgi:hypothetical protein